MLAIAPLGKNVCPNVSRILLMVADRSLETSSDKSSCSQDLILLSCFAHPGLLQSLFSQSTEALPTKDSLALELLLNVSAHYWHPSAVMQWERTGNYHEQILAQPACANLGPSPDLNTTSPCWPLQSMQRRGPGKAQTWCPLLMAHTCFCGS